MRAITSNSLEGGMCIVSMSETVSSELGSPGGIGDSGIVVESGRVSDLVPMLNVHLFISRKSSPKMASVVSPSATMTGVWNVHVPKQTGTVACPCS